MSFYQVYLTLLYLEYLRNDVLQTVGNIKVQTMKNPVINNDILYSLYVL